MEKSLLRKKHKSLRLAQNEDILKKKSEAIFSRLKSFDFYKKSKNIMLYLSLRGEVETSPIISDLLFLNKNLYAPVCDENYAMRAVHFSSFDDLVSGKYGILVPKGSEEIAPEHLDLIIVPGCVFGRNLHRIGYGKGYYDRFLKGAPFAKKVGLSFSVNIENEVSFSQFDVPMDVIITEDEVIM